ncbi:MAG: preprotein translocase subunit SecA, partial [Alphaproteobacteria bacterium]|nr:preprotein translocase subunit SecA [Alphaproteobacteria bacterium]
MVLQRLILRLMGSTSDRLVASLRPDVTKINAVEAELQDCDDTEILEKSQALRARAREGETLDDLLIEAFALVREAAKRTIRLRHFDVQLLGGMILHRGAIAEMKTGEGKTLVATLAVYLNGLSGKGVHVVTVNDYLASRDAAWMGKIYEFLGLDVGVIRGGMDDVERRAAYACDVTFATNNELAFDYLRDNLKFSKEQLVQRGFHFAIVDEVDSILIDEARTPLIISGAADSNPELFYLADKLARKLEEEHFEKDEKQHSLTLTEAGNERAEELLKNAGVIAQGNLYDLENVMLVHHINQALRAQHLFTRDVEYIVRDRQLLLIDEFTGRIMDGRRYSDGLHQALEAKEGLDVQKENQTLALVTFQNFFRLYEKMGGMTGTALTEAAEFEQIYNLPVYELPTNLPMVRVDHQDEIYGSSTERDMAVITQIKACHNKKQPVLVGTVSIEKSENFSKLLKEHGLTHKVLNARQHESEAWIIAEAGVPGAITIATNMAGRGTDIQLGGNFDARVQTLREGDLDAATLEPRTAKIAEAVAQGREVVLGAGGLYVIGTERHESRRIDNQLRGRSGRQGDVGESKFFVSLSDDLMRIFGSERLEGMLKKLGLEQGEAIVHPWVSKAIERAQRKVEERNFEIRKQLLKFDDVMNEQRTVVFEYRRELMDTVDVSTEVEEFRHQQIDAIIDAAMPARALPDEWDMEQLHQRVLQVLAVEVDAEAWKHEEGLGSEEARSRLREMSDIHMAKKTVRITAEVMRAAERTLMLQFLDAGWKDHLLQLEHLRQGIGLRAMAQRDPLNEYKQEAFTLFQGMLDRMHENVVQFLSW